MNLHRFGFLLASAILGISGSNSILAEGGGHGGGRGGGHGGGGHGGHGGGHGGSGHHGSGHGHHGGGHGFHGGGGRLRLGLYFSPSYGRYYPSSPYYDDPRRTLAAPVYVEQTSDASLVQEANWYYCADSKTYYPYVHECMSGWQRVPAQPPPNP